MSICYLVVGADRFDIYTPHTLLLWVDGRQDEHFPGNKLFFRRYRAWFGILNLNLIKFLNSALIFYRNCVL